MRNIEIIKKASKIINNIDFTVIKIDVCKDGMSVLLQDKKSELKFWFDLWKENGELVGDWNEFIFDTNNSIDCVRKYIQENNFVFEEALQVSINAYENELYLK